MKKQEKSFLFLYLIFIVLLFFPLFFKPNNAHDFISQAYPFTEFDKRYFKKHLSFPYWNPFIVCGTPNIDQGRAIPFHYLLLYIFPAEFAPTWLYIIFVLLGGIFAYIFFKEISNDRYSSLVAGLVYMLSGNMVTFIFPGHFGKPIVMALIPLALFLIEKGFKSKRKIYFLLTGLVFAYQYFGHPQVFYYSLWFTTGYFILKVLNEYKKGNKDKRIILHGIINYGIIGVTAVITALNQLIPQYYYAKLTARGGGGTKSLKEVWDFATSWSMHPVELLTFLHSSFFGHYPPFYAGWMPFDDTTRYIGVIPVLLAIIGTVKYWKKWEVKYSFFFAIFGILFGLGKFFPQFYKFFFNYIPLIKKFRVPSSMYLIVTFNIVYLAFYGLLSLMEKKDKKIGKWIITGIVILILLVIFYGSGYYIKTLNSHLNYNYLLVNYVLNQAKNELIKIWLIFGIFILLLYLFYQSYIQKKSFSILLAILLGIDLILVDKDFIHTIDNYDYVSKPDEIVKFLKERLKKEGKFRILPFPPRIDNESNKWCFFDIESAFGYHAIGLKIYDDVLRATWFTSPKLLGLMNIKYLISSQRIIHPELKEIAVIKNKVIYSNRRFLPRYFFVQKYKIITNELQALQYTKSGNFYPEKEVIFMEKIPQLNFSTNGNKLSLVKWEYDEFTLKVNIKNPVILFMSEVFYPKWKCYIIKNNQKKEIKVYRANYLFRAVILKEKGEYLVEMKFKKGLIFPLLTWVHFIVSGILLFAGIKVIMAKK